MKYERDIDLRTLGRIAVRTGGYRRRKARALEIVREAFAREPGPAYVAVSGGKDSVALAHVVHEVAHAMGRDFVLWCHVSDASFPGTVETVQALAERLGRELVLDESPVSAFDVVGRQSRARFGKKGYFFQGIRRFVESGGFRLVFTGVRAAESKRRRNALRARGPIFETTVPAPILRCDPLAWWRVEDVAAEIVKYFLPIHPIYDKIAVRDRTIRLGYVTALDLLDRGTVVFLKLNYPELYTRLVRAFPEAAQYA